MTSDEIKNGTCLIIPTYNNEKTVQQVVEEVKQYHLHVILVNDGSTDRTHQLIKEMEVEWIEYPHNKGKGYALKQGFKRAVALGYRYAITIDSDGQHYASDIPKFLDAVAQHPDNLIVGSRFLNTENMPSANSFANRFSNFWFQLQTRIPLPDTQSGYRLYPLHKIKNIHFFSNRYEAELEMLVRSAWRFIPIMAIPINVYYPPQEERVTHFRPFFDFFRISVLNTIFTIFALIYFYPKKFLFYRR